MSSINGFDDHDRKTDRMTLATGSSTEQIGNEAVDGFRVREYPQLTDKVYLDHGGSTLYVKSLIEDFVKDLTSILYGNPHSDSVPSAIAGHRIDIIRKKALCFFKADPKEWDLVFVANATAAMKLTAECLIDHAAYTQTQLWYGYHRDAHTNLVGIRELTPTSRCFTSDDEVEEWISYDGTDGPLPHQLGLFAYSGQSNMTGRRLPHTWPSKIREKLIRGNIYTLFDAAALASTAQLDFSNVSESPDFVALSFYKTFGFPNIGALLVRKSSAHVLANRKYFGGGTVDMVVTIDDKWHARKTTTIHDALEDGTLPFHSIFALDHAIDVHKRLYSSEPMEFISRHTAQLSKQLYDDLCSLRHRNGKAVIRIYNEPTAVHGDSKTQGPTIAFNVLNADSTLVPYKDVEKLGNAYGIYIRSGSLCNPGGMATYLSWTPQEMKAAFAYGHRCSDPTELVNGKATGVIRISLGGMSTASDVRALIDFLNISYADITIPRTAPLVDRLLSINQATFQENRILKEEEIKATAWATPATNAPLSRSLRALCNRFRHNFDFGTRSPRSSTALTSSARLPYR